jgi:zinc protease
MLDRSLAPGFIKKKYFKLSQPEIEHLQGGLDLVSLPGLQQKIVKVEVIFKAGKWYESSPGQSHFTAAVIDKGTATKSSKEIAQIFDYYGAQVEISPGYDFTSISLYTMEKHLPEIFAVFKEIITCPTFPEEELILQKEIYVQNLKINNQKNSFVASKLLRKNIFGENHPYGRILEEKDVDQLTVEDLKIFFKRDFHPVEIYLLGNLNPGQFEWLTQEFNFVPPQKNEGMNFPTEPGRMSQLLAKPGSVQSSIRLGKQIINRLHPDYFSVILLNHILGGYFGSRLMKSIREEKGLTYGIYSAINPFKNDCIISIGADVNNDQLEIARKEIKKELEVLKEIPISEEELTIAKNHFLGTLQLEVANPFAVLDKIKSIRLNGLSQNYYDDLFSSIGSLRSESLLETAKKYFEPDSFQEVVVG